MKAAIKKGALKIRPAKIKTVDSPEYKEDFAMIVLMKGIAIPALKNEANVLYNAYSIFRGNVLKRASMRRAWMNFVIKNSKKKK